MLLIGLKHAQNNYLMSLLAVRVFSLLGLGPVDAVDVFVRRPEILNARGVNIVKHTSHVIQYAIISCVSKHVF